MEARRASAASGQGLRPTRMINAAEYLISLQWTAQVDAKTRLAQRLVISIRSNLRTPDEAHKRRVGDLPTCRERVDFVTLINVPRLVRSAG